VRLTFTVVDPLAQRRADIILDTEPEATVSRVGVALARLLRPGSQVTTLYVEGTAVDPQLALSASPLREGALVSLDDPAGCPRPEPAGLVEVRVVSGPDAGGMFRLDPGVAHIGGDPGATVGIEDPSLPATAVTIEVAAEGTVVVTPRTDLPTWLNGERLAGAAPWPVGGQLAVGWTVLELAAPAPPDAQDPPGRVSRARLRRRLSRPVKEHRRNIPSPQ